MVVAIVEYKENGAKIKMAMEKANKRGLTAAAELVLSQSKTLTPVDTGKLRDDQFYVVDDESATVGSPTEYAEQVEDRTPFLTPAFRMNKENIRKLIEQALKEEVK